MGGAEGEDEGGEIGVGGLRLGGEGRGSEVRSGGRGEVAGSEEMEVAEFGLATSDGGSEPVRDLGGGYRLGLAEGGGVEGGGQPLAGGGELGDGQHQ